MHSFFGNPVVGNFVVMGIFFVVMGFLWRGDLSPMGCEAAPSLEYY
jgi:hypothetical protein